MSTTSLDEFHDTTSQPTSPVISNTPVKSSTDLITPTSQLQSLTLNDQSLSINDQLSTLNDQSSNQSIPPSDMNNDDESIESDTNNTSNESTTILSLLKSVIHKDIDSQRISVPLFMLGMISD